LMTLVAATFFVVMVNTSDRLFDASLARSYLAATLLMWLFTSAAYSLAIGGAVNRQVSRVQAALDQRDDAEARAKSEAFRLRVLLEEAPIGLLLQGPDETFDYGNAPALEMLELTEEVLFSHGTTPSMEQSTLERVEQEVVIAREQGKGFVVEFQTVGGRILELRGRHVDLGESSTTVSTIRDLTPERDARRHIARLRTLVENSQAHMAVWNRRGEIVVANRVFREMWSPLQPVEGRSVTEVVGEQIRHLVEMSDLRQEQSFEMEVLLPGGEAIWVNISVADFPDPFDDEWLRSISVRDLTEVAHARRQLEQLVVSKDRFIASVSHELRTPLTVVVGLAAELADRPERLSIEEVQEFASLICSQANDVTSIVEDLLTMARAQAGALTVNCQRIDLEAIVAEVVGSLPSNAVKSVSWTPRGPAWVWADPIRLRQILRNLVTNADRHGGQIIEVEIRPGELLVKDDGPPLPEGDRERIFEAYEQIGRPTSRTDSVGLGLAVCRLLSRLMDGDVVYSHDGAQSIFTLTLPIR
jgi:PAS domain S-box-containing protein